MPFVQVQNLTLRYGKKKEVLALNDFSANFDNGKLNVIIGPSGCGKSSLLRAIIGLEKYEGSILFDGANVNSFSTKERNIGYVNERIALFPHLSLFENIATPLKPTLASGEEIRQRVNEVAKEVGIEECLARKPSQVSFGQCQRAAIAKALIKKPSIYLFDEPFSSIDEPRAIDLRKLVKSIFSREGATVIFVTHNLKEAVNLGDRFIIMESGTCLAEGDQMSLRNNVNPKVSGIFLNDANFI